MSSKPKYSSRSVNANSETYYPTVHSDSSEVSSMRASSLHRVKNEIQTVLDLMGPSTTSLPSHNPNPPEEPEEEEEDTSISSSILKDVSTSLSTQAEPQVTLPSSIAETEHTLHPPSKCCSLHHTPRENGDSHLADFGSSSTLTLHQIDSMLSQMGCLSPHHQHDGAHMCTNQNCKCMMTGYLHQSFIPMVSQKVCKCVNVAQKHLALSEVKRQKLLEWLKKLKSYDLKLKKTPALDPCELYRVNISGGDDGDGNRPRRLIFDLVEGIPRPYSNTVGTNTRKEKKSVSPLRKKVVNRGTSAGNSRNNSFTTFERKRRTGNKSSQKYEMKENLVYYNNEKNNVKNQVFEEVDYKIKSNNEEKKHGEEQKTTFYDSNGDTRVDFYYFDHGNAEFLNTTDSQPVMKCEILAEKTEKYTTKFWAEFFASIHIAIAFGISFLLQLFKFLLYSIIRPLTVGMMQLGSDYFFKPCLTTLFNGIIQPFLIFLYNIMTTIRDLFDPLAECCGFFLRECGLLCKNIRLCSYKSTGNCKCEAETKCI